MLTLLLAALLWIALHLGLAGTRLRDGAVARLGEGGFLGLFSLLSLGSLWWLIHAYGRADTTPLWHAPAALRWVLAALMLPAFVLLLAAFTTPNPTSVGGERAMLGELTGIQRVTRHPMLWGVALWAAVHMLGNGDSASLAFFGAFLVTALAGMPSIDAKLARRDPSRFAAVARQTSVLPFAAIAAGRNRFALREIGLVALGGGALLWALLLHLHARVFGVPVLL